jgi:hypothetical protein
MRGARYGAAHLLAVHRSKNLQINNPARNLRYSFGAVACIHSLGTNLNAHVHFLCAVDGVFKVMTREED